MPVLSADEAVVEALSHAGAPVRTSADEDRIYEMFVASRVDGILRWEPGAVDTASALTPNTPYTFRVRRCVVTTRTSRVPTGSRATPCTSLAVTPNRPLLDGVPGVTWIRWAKRIELAGRSLGMGLSEDPAPVLEHAPSSSAS